MASKHFQSRTFAVGSQFGERSSEWCVSLDGDDVYITHTKMSKVMHGSLHKSGQWHIKMAGTDAVRKQVIVAKSHRELISTEHYRVAAYIIIPDRCLRPSSDPYRSTEPAIWLERPPYGGVVEISVIEWDLRRFGQFWPGAAAGTRPFVVYNHDNISAVGLFFRTFLPGHEVTSEAERVTSAIVTEARKHNANQAERRGVHCSSLPAGALSFLEFAID